jgi:uncharacterized protein (DUF3084 family)
MTFLDLAKKLDKDVADRAKELDLREQKLEQKASLLAAREQTAVDRDVELDRKDKDIQQRLEQLSYKELTFKRHSDVESEAVAADKKLSTAESLMKKMVEKEAEVNLKLQELALRELALSKKEKTYKDDIKKQMIENAFGVTF